MLQLAAVTHLARDTLSRRVLPSSSASDAAITFHSADLLLARYIAYDAVMVKSARAAMARTPISPEINRYKQDHEVVRITKS